MKFSPFPFHNLRVRLLYSWTSCAVPRRLGHLLHGAESHSRQARKTFRQFLCGFMIRSIWSCSHIKPKKFCPYTIFKIKMAIPCRYKSMFSSWCIQKIRIIENTFIWIRFINFNRLSHTYDPPFLFLIALYQNERKDIIKTYKLYVFVLLFFFFHFIL